MMSTGRWTEAICVQPLLLGIADKTQGSPILDTTARVLEFRLPVDVRAGLF